MVAVHVKWTADYQRQALDDTYKDALDALFESFEAGDIPADLRDLADTLPEFDKQYADFASREEELDGYPQQAFWSAFENFRRVLENPNEVATLPPLESVQLLNEQKVSHSQIAKMYGLIDAKGVPQAHLIQKELDDPGSVIGPDWVDPRQKEFDEARAAAGRHAEKLQKAAEPTAAPDKPCPETPRELWEQKVSAEQSAKMLKQPLEPIKKQWAAWDDEARKLAEAKLPKPPAKKTPSTKKPPKAP
jgi:hypothetical protein